jgi:hypothetical protein
MPMDRKLYPANWNDMALQIKLASKWTCQQCDRPCRLPGESAGELTCRIKEQHPQWSDELADVDGEPKLGRFTLTTAHIHHDAWNAKAELRAWCTVCHGRYDLKAIPTKRRLKRERLGQLNLLWDLAGNGEDAMRVQRVLFAGDGW